MYRVDFDSARVTQQRALNLLDSRARELLMDRMHIKWASVLAHGKTLVVQLPPMTPDRMALARRRLTQRVAFAMHVAQEYRRGTPRVGRDYPKGGVYKPNTFMRDLSALVRSSARAKELGIEAKRDGWRTEASNERFYDRFLLAKNRRVLETFVDSVVNGKNGPKLSSDVVLGYEHIGGVGWRTMLLRKKASLTGDDIERATVVFNRQTSIPEVLITLTKSGATRFGTATGMNVGRRLAIVVDGTIVSAPILQAKIMTGRSRITLGGTDYRARFGDANSLVYVLRLAAAGATLVEERVEQVQLASRAQCVEAMNHLVQLALDKEAKSGSSAKIDDKAARDKMFGMCKPNEDQLLTRQQIACFNSATNAKDVEACVRD